MAMTVTALYVQSVEETTMDLSKLKLGKPKAKFYTTIKFKEPICKDGAVGRKARRIIRRGG